MAQLKLKTDGTYQGLIPDFAIEVHEMPQVTSTDNGKLARVVDGAWAAVEVSSAENVAVTSTPADTYLMLGATYLLLNNAVNTKCGTTGNHTLSELITILGQ